MTVNNFFPYSFTTATWKAQKCIYHFVLYNIKAHTIYNSISVVKI